MTLLYLASTLVQAEGTAGADDVPGNVMHMLIFCTGAGTDNFDFASERLQYRVKSNVLEHIRSPHTAKSLISYRNDMFIFELGPPLRTSQYLTISTAIFLQCHKGLATRWSEFLRVDSNPPLRSRKK